MNTKEFIESLCRNLKQDEWPEIEATLILENQPPAKGRFVLGSKLRGQANFHPIDESIVGKCPSNSGVLIMSGRTERLRVTNLRACSNPNPSHFHFDFEPI